jgi:hypothetical protein
MFWFKKKPVPKPIPKKTPKRVAVHCPDGTTVVHYAVYRTVRSDGGLVLHNADDQGQIVAHYAPGHWASLSAGKRKVSV